MQEFETDLEDMRKGQERHGSSIFQDLRDFRVVQECVHGHGHVGL